ncbi:EAL domain-containing protein [Idiomarina sp.]|uniref:putative bifunctional diguanylate cyclase/phosphodiesterase n=1 Tax=Idiomarina sp. TaxID=1874361 RepID=UPI0025C65CE1|nr:EAL domain-containing protein [Idiomarina sp.]
MPTLDLITGLAIETITHSVQTLLLLGFAGLLRFYFASYDYAYLRYWSFACFSYGFSELIRVTLGALGMGEIQISATSVQLAQAVALALQYLAIVYIALGTLDAIDKRQPSRLIRYSGYATAGLGGVIAWLSSNSLSVAISNPNQSFLQFLVPALLFFAIGIPMWSKIKAGIGPRLVACGFLFVAFKNLVVVAAIQTLSDHPLDWVIAVQGVFTVIFLAIVMVGIIIWLLESERNTSVRAIQRAEYLHTHDALTGVSNRAQLVLKIPHLIDFCRSNNRQLTVCLIGISRFKSINESLGIKGGDKVLKEVASRLRHFHKTPLAVARISGDVFAIVFDHLKSRHLLKDLGNELQQSLSMPITVGEKSVAISVGVGISRYPQHGTNAEILLNKATIALTESKRHHQPGVVFFERGMDDMFSQLLDMEPVLKRAFKNNEFLLYLQPQFDFDHQQLCGFEALIRWQHPERGLLSPAEFLPYIEQLGMTDTLDSWVLEKAAATLKRWHQKFDHCWPIAVNLSAQQFQHFQLIDQLQAVVDKYQIAPAALELEITETVAMSDLHNGMSVINKLRAMGFNVAIDDFGTGHSSLAYLRSLPISKIKIDRSFVSELQVNRTDATILKAMIRLAHGLGKRVIAEGIETEDQQMILQQLGCDMMQGYYYSPPMRLEFAEQLIERELEEGREPLPAPFAAAAI